MGLFGAVKPLLFGICGAVGGFVASIGGEVLLALLLPPAASQSNPPRPIDIAFVLDITTSMREEFAGVQAGIKDFAREIETKDLDWRLGLVAFRDRLAGEKSAALAFQSGALTASSKEFREEVGKLTLSGGGYDESESSLDAMVLAAGQPFRADATKVILLITDAAPHVPDLETPSEAELLEVLREESIDQVHLVVREEDLSFFQSWQTTAPGEVFFIGETVRERAQFGKILPEVGKAIAEETIKGLPSQQEFTSESANQVIAVFSLWTGVLGVGIALALTIGQNVYLRRRVLTLGQGIKGTGGSLIAGLIAGIAGQLLFVPVAEVVVLVSLGRVVGWSLLGGLLGAGMSAFIPNLK